MTCCRLRLTAHQSLQNILYWALGAGWLRVHQVLLPWEVGHPPWAGKLTEAFLTDLGFAVVKSPPNLGAE